MERLATKAATPDKYEQGTASYIVSVYNSQPETKASLVADIKEVINEDGNNANLNYIDTSLITDMRYLFAKDVISTEHEAGYGFETFNGDISKWTVSKVTDMRKIFYGTDTFNGDISKWDVSSVTDMSFMFSEATAFDGDIPQ